jgi:biotin transport system substrate-specific component
MNTLTLDRIRLTDFALVMLASCVICLFGHISIPLWFTPIPLATQNMAILIVGAVLGSRRGLAAVLAFLAQGLAGLPVFANGDSGLHILMGPRGGYLIGYAFAAFVVGYLIEKKKHPLLALFAGQVAIFACGAGYLSSFVGMEKAFYLGVTPFLFGDFLKLLACWKILNWKKAREMKG